MWVDDDSRERPSREKTFYDEKPSRHNHHQPSPHGFVPSARGDQFDAGELGEDGVQVCFFTKDRRWYCVMDRLCHRAGCRMRCGYSILANPARHIEFQCAVQGVGRVADRLHVGECGLEWWGTVKRVDARWAAELYPSGTLSVDHLHHAFLLPSYIYNILPVTNVVENLKSAL